MKIKLETLRIKNGYTQSEMAKKLDIPVSTYYVYETGKRKVPTDVAKQIAKILKEDINNIFLPATFTLSKINNNKDDIA